MNQRQKYLDILGLHAQATELEIKKKYRKLVFIYHPDKNNGDNSKFIVITEAYDILLGRKIPQPSSQNLKANTYSSKPATYEQRVKDAQKRYKQYSEREQESNLRYFRKITSGIGWKIMRWNAIMGGLITFIILLDLGLPSHYENSRITEFSDNTFGSFQGDQVRVIRLENGESYFISGINYKVILHFPEVIVRKSWVFHNPKELLTIEGMNVKPHGIHFNFGTMEFLVIFLSLLPVLTYFYKRPNINFTVIYHFSLYFSSGFILYYIISNDRWAHLFTLGFL